MADEVLLESHEQRLQALATLTTEMAATMSTLTTKLDGIESKVDDVGRKVDDLKTTTEDHGVKLALLLQDREDRETQKKAWVKVGFATFLAMLGGVATKWGEVIYTWLTGHKGP